MLLKWDLKLEIFVGVLKGDIFVYMYCYCVDEMIVMMDVMKEFNYKIGIFYYVVEVYKIVDILKEN